MLSDNLLLMTDSYKVSHWKQYPKGTTRVFSFLEARNGGEFDHVTFFGLNYILKKYLEGPVVTMEKIADAARFYAAHFGSEEHFNRQGWEYIARWHRGHLPVIIKAVPEGTTVPTGNVLLTIENLDPEVPWLVTYLETLLVQVWYPTTVATQSRAMKKMIRDAMRESGADMSGLDFKLHDFGYRGSTSVESAGIGGAAHLVNFKGTDTVAGLEVAYRYYNEPMAGFSIPAAEHSTITSWGRENEKDAYANMLTQYPTGLVAVVSDSYDIFNAVSRIWGDELRDRVMYRDGTVVIRPDSGDPVYVVLRLLGILGEKFGFTKTEQGFKVLNPKVRLIQGDGIDKHSLQAILNAMLANGWSIDNIAFGSGGGLLQKVNRDTCRFAMKCSAIEVNGKWRPVFKNPATDVTKQSKLGRLILRDDGKNNTEGDGFYTDVETSAAENKLEKVFQSGVVYDAPSLATVRERAAL